MGSLTLGLVLSLSLVQAGPDPDRVIRAPDGQDLRDRWTWAERTAREAGGPFWIGWAVRGDTTGQTWHFVDRGMPVHARTNIAIGTFYVSGGMAGGLSFPGAPLRPLVGEHDSHDTVILLRYRRTQGRDSLERVHVGSFAFPVHFEGGTLLWLGRAADAASVSLLRTVFAGAQDNGIRRDIVGAAGAHTDAAAVTAASAAWLDDDALAPSVRREAAAWLGYHAHPDGVAVLTRRARADTSVSVRSAAVRALPRAAPASVAVAELVRLAREDSDARIRRDAVTALGSIRAEPAFRALVELIEQPGDSAMATTRRQAVSTLARPGSQEPQPQQVLDLLARVAKNDSTASVRNAAVDALASLRDPRTIPILLDLARTAPDTRVQQRAAQGLGRVDAERALDPLRQLIWEHPRPEVQTAAARALIMLATEDARQLLADVAERHERPEVRRTAVQALINARFR